MGSYFDLLDNNDHDDDDYTLTDYRHLNEIKIKFNPRVVVFIYAVAGYLLFYRMFLYGN